jgi:hypothetical protein
MFGSSYIASSSLAHANSRCNNSCPSLGNDILHYLASAFFTAGGPEDKSKANYNSGREECNEVIGGNSTAAERKRLAFSNGRPLFLQFCLESGELSEILSRTPKQLRKFQDVQQWTRAKGARQAALHGINVDWDLWPSSGTRSLLRLKRGSLIAHSRPFCLLQLFEMNRRDQAAPLIIILFLRP